MRNAIPSFDIVRSYHFMKAYFHMIRMKINKVVRTENDIDAPARG